MTQEHLWEQLTQLLQAECAAYGQLLDILGEEWSVLRTVNYHGLLEMSGRKEHILAHITQIEHDRATCIRELHRDAGQGESLQWLSKSTLPHARPAQRIFKELKAIGLEVKQLSDRNAGLIGRGLHVVREALNVVQEGFGMQSVYEISGRLTVPTIATSLNLEG